MLVLTDTNDTARSYHLYTVLPIKDYLHCRHTLLSLLRRGVLLNTLRIDILDQETLFAALDPHILSRIVREKGVIQVVTHVHKHYMIHHVGRLLLQMKQIRVVADGNYDGVTTGCIGRVLVRICRYVPFASSIRSIFWYKS